MTRSTIYIYRDVSDYFYLFPFLWVQPFQEDQQDRPVATPARATEENELGKTTVPETSVVAKTDDGKTKTNEENTVEPTQVVTPTPSQAALPSDEETEEINKLPATATRKACDHGGPGVESAV